LRFAPLGVLASLVRVAFGCGSGLEGAWEAAGACPGVGPRVGSVTMAGTGACAGVGRAAGGVAQAVIGVSLRAVFGPGPGLRAGGPVL
jgi:hypothetical protein